MRIKPTPDRKQIGITVVALIGSVFIGMKAYAAAVESMSLEKFIEAEQSYWHVSVKCENVEQPRSMQKPITGDNWCASDAPTVCNENKFTASRMVCADNFAQKVSDDESAPIVTDPVPKSAASAAPDTTKAETNSKPVAAPSPQPATTAPASIEAKKLSETDLLKEQNQIESQRILIQQKRLELQRRELELKKAQMDGQQ
ncbi:hypothetical protein GCM10008090_28090 [Arenicella chitinivorans]|uniref:Uncharacterized protein n=1 Tax=Arenicella chitinivorans TaxID=1329800 RepID=A0A918RY10_9GAMM|nr:hypothetical protein [Arenicella chitinivorans]GHA16827.1 hypothetical protein GCM10008090_28090 [Arenicella chitinivorans]